MTVLGLDLSLTSTGVATKNWTRAIRTKKLRSYPRLRYIREQILEVLIEARPQLVVVEGPSLGSQGSGFHQLGGLWWMMTEVIDDAGIELAVAPPSNIKKYATGYGGGPKSGKDAVLLAAVRRFDWFEGGNDEADALWACAMGHQWLNEPLVEMPALNKKGLDGVAWPTAVTFSQRSSSPVSV